MRVKNWMGLAVAGALTMAVTQLVLPAFAVDVVAPMRADERYTVNAMDLWELFLHKNVDRGDPLKKVDELLAGKFRDKADITLGGTGRREVYYLIDDFLQVCVSVTHLDRVEETRVSVRGKWLRKPDGQLYCSPIYKE